MEMLGGFAIVDGEKRIIEQEKRSSKTWKMLQYLVTHRHKVVTQEELAERIDVTPQMISTAELGKKAIRPENLLKLCQALEVSADYLLTGFIGEKDIALIARKLSLLSPEQFRVAEDILNGCIRLSKAGK